MLPFDLGLHSMEDHARGKIGNRATGDAVEHMAGATERRGVRETQLQLRALRRVRPDGEKDARFREEPKARCPATFERFVTSHAVGVVFHERHRDDRRDKRFKASPRARATDISLDDLDGVRKRAIGAGVDTNR